MADFTMPALGADMQTGKLVAWHVKPGDEVRTGDVVAVVETHKGAIDVEIFLDGVIGDLAPLGKEFPVGARLATVRLASGPASTRQRVSPAARQRAQASHLDLSALVGTGVEGAITLADVARAAAAAAQPPQPQLIPQPQPQPQGLDPTPMRAAIAAAMARSKREIPHYYLSQAIPLGEALSWLAGHNQQAPVTQRVLPAVLLIKATAVALAHVPELNGLYLDGRYRPSAAVHAGIAIALRGGGLIAPALHDVQAKPLQALMAELSELVTRARSGGLRSSEMTDATITITNLGERGVDAVFGVIYPPQVALVGFGHIMDQPWVRDGQVGIQPVVQASLSADHRVSDGHAGARFLAALSDALQRPAAL
jgi:pyruvate dehydrogenase E2 component (dihydrolipoamide acetyltransferase)